MLDPWLYIECQLKTLMRQGGCAGWYVSLMGAHAFLYFLLDTTLVRIL